MSAFVCCIRPKPQSVHRHTGNAMEPHAKPGRTDVDSSGRYLRGQAGYSRWYGNGPPQQTTPTRPPPPQYKPRVDRYMKGEEGYKRWYGQPPGPPTYKYQH